MLSIMLLKDEVNKSQNHVRMYGDSRTAKSREQGRDDSIKEFSIQENDSNISYSCKDVYRISGNLRGENHLCDNYSC